MRMIDADSLQRRICGAKCGCEYEDCGSEGDCGYDHFISNAPTINAVPVVRKPVVGYEGYYADDFCSYGERKEGADNEP